MTWALRGRSTGWGGEEMEISTTGELVAYLRDKKFFFREKFGVIRIGVFGSFSQGGQNTKSDIDLVVEFEKSRKNIHAFLQLRRLLEKELSRKVDLGLERSLKPIVGERIKGKVIYV
jgi:predicted nucleotidyltransferase